MLVLLIHRRESNVPWIVPETKSWTFLEPKSSSFCAIPTPQRRSPSPLIQRLVPSPMSWSSDSPKVNHYEYTASFNMWPGLAPCLERCTRSTTTWNVQISLCTWVWKWNRYNQRGEHLRCLADSTLCRRLFLWLLFAITTEQSSQTYIKLCSLIRDPVSFYHSNPTQHCRHG